MKKILFFILIVSICCGEEIFVLLPGSVERKLNQAEEFIKNKQYKEGIEIYREFLSSPPTEAMIKLNDELAIGVKEYCRKKLRNLPEEAKMEYIKLIDFRARKLMKNAKKFKDIHRCKRIIFDYPGSSYEDYSLFLLTQDAIDSAKFDHAIQYINFSKMITNGNAKIKNIEKYAKQEELNIKPSFSQIWTYTWNPGGRERAEFYIFDTYLYLISHALDRLFIFDPQNGNTLYTFPQLGLKKTPLFYVNEENLKVATIGMQQLYSPYERKGKLQLVIRERKLNSSTWNEKKYDIPIEIEVPGSPQPYELINLPEKSNLIYFTNIKSTPQFATHVFISCFDVEKKKLLFTNQWIGSIVLLPDKQPQGMKPIPPELRNKPPRPPLQPVRPSFRHLLLRSLSITENGANIILFLSNNIIVSFDALTGELMWMRKFPGETKFDPSTTQYPSLPYISTDEENIYCLFPDSSNLFSINSLTGELVWSKKLNRESILIGARNGIIGISELNKIVALKKDGTQAWEYNSNSLRTGISAMNNRYIYSPFGNEIHVIDLQTGNLLYLKNREKNESCYIFTNKDNLYILTRSSLSASKISIDTKK